VARPLRAAARSSAALLLAGGTVVAVLLHLRAAYHYPAPWPDEAHFLAPAWSLARGLTLATPQLGLPEGIYWIPDGYYLTLAGVFALLPPSLAVARGVSLVLALGFAGCVFGVVRRLNGRMPLVAAAIAVWLAAPRVVLLANVARMEALLLALTGVALLLAARRRWTLALAVASIAVLVHPAGLPVLLALCLAAALGGVDLRPRGRFEVVLAVLVALAWLGEAWHVAGHLDLAREHLGFQLARKQRTPVVGWGDGLLLLAALLGAILARGAPERTGAERNPTALGLFLVAVSLTAVGVLGQEMWYEVLGIETAALLVVAGVACMPGRRQGCRWAPCVAVAAVVAAVTTTPHGYAAYGMRLDGSTPAEYATFAEDAVGELRRLDAQQPGPRTVRVDALSGFPPVLAEGPWRHLRFIQHVPVAALPEADYALSTLGPPDVLRRFIADRLPPGPPLLRVTSSRGTFELRLYAV
jgi:hypothetical protein